MANVLVAALAEDGPRASCEGGAPLFHATPDKLFAGKKGGRGGEGGLTVIRLKRGRKDLLFPVGKHICIYCTYSIYHNLFFLVCFVLVLIFAAFG